MVLGKAHPDNLLNLELQGSASEAASLWELQVTVGLLHAVSLVAAGYCLGIELRQFLLFCARITRFLK